MESFSQSLEQFFLTVGQNNFGDKIPLLFFLKLQNASEDKDLKCFYAHNNSPWLKLAPIKIDMQNHEPYVAVLRELMYTHECDGITIYLGNHLGSPPGRMKKKGGGKNDWTMKK